MKDPIEVLLDEHKIITSAIDLANHADELWLKNEAVYEIIIRKLISFFRIYADLYHHHKEEKILFPEMQKKNELLQDGVLKEMFNNHEDFRNMINSIETFLDKKNYQSAQEQLNIYLEDLLDHIAVENEEVFQIAETLFNKEELEKIYFRFQDSDFETEEQNKINGLPNKSELAKELQEMHKTFLVKQH